MALTQRDPNFEFVQVLERAHKMSVSSADIPKSATLYGQAALTIIKLAERVRELEEDLRDKSGDGRKEDEWASWGTLLPERQLYPETFKLLRTDTGAGHYGRLSENKDKIYGRNFPGLLQPVPGQLWRREETDEVYLVLATAVHPTHAVMDVERYFPTEDELAVRK